MKQSKRNRCYIILFIATSFNLGIVAQAQLLFHHSFDRSNGTRANQAKFAPDPISGVIDGKSPKPDRAATRFEIIDSGKFAEATRTHNHAFSGPGQINPYQGALSLWFRYPEKPVEGFQRLFQINTFNENWFREFLRFHFYKGKLWLSIIDRDYNVHGLTFEGAETNTTLNPAQQGWQAGKWYHLVVNWDAAMGLQIYIDAQEVYSTWGKRHYPIFGKKMKSIGLPGQYGSGGLLTKSRFDLDELYIFESPLNTQTISELFARNISSTKNTNTSFDKNRRYDQRVLELGWNTPGALASVDADHVTHIDILPVTSAKEDDVWAWKAVDGRSATCFPLVYKRGANKNLTIRLSDTDSSFNAMGVLGGFKGRVDLNNNMTDVIFSGDSFRQYKHFPSRVHSTRIDFHRDTKQPPPPKTTNYPANNLAEACFFKIDRQKTFSDENSERWTCELTQPTTLDSLSRLYPSCVKTISMLFSETRPDERMVVTVSPQQTLDQSAASLLNVPAGHFLTVFVPPSHEDRLIDGIEVKCSVGKVQEETRLFLRAVNPALIIQDLFDIDIKLDKSFVGYDYRKLRLSIDVPATVVPSGRPLVLTLCPEKEISFDLNHENGIDVTLKGPRDDTSLKKDLTTFKNRALNQLKDFYVSHNERRPWNIYYENQLNNLKKARRGFPELEHMFGLLETARDYFPNDPVLLALARTTGHDAPDASNNIDSPVDIPKWAALVQAIALQYQKTVDYWLREHGSTNQGLTCDVSDGGDLIHEWVDLALISDPDKSYENSLTAMANAAWNDPAFTSQGFNSKLLDALHAYETGLNIQPDLFLLRYGDPVIYERMARTSATIQERFLWRDSKGATHFIGDHLGMNRSFSSDGDMAWDRPMCGLWLHPALIMAWYNRNPDALSLLVDYVGGWADLIVKERQKDKKNITLWPNALHRSGKIKRLPRFPWDHGFASLLLGVLDMTHDPRVIELLKTTQREKVCLPQFFGHYLPYLTSQGWTAPPYLKYRGYFDIPYSEWSLNPDSTQTWLQVAQDELQAARERFELNTVLEPSPDRVYFKRALATYSYLGGYATTRNQFWPFNAVSWEHMSIATFAARVSVNTETSLEMELFNFTDAPLPTSFISWRLLPGTYCMKTISRPDNSTLEQKFIKITPMEQVNLTLSPKQQIKVELRGIRFTSRDFSKPDLAISNLDLKNDHNQLKVIIHNIGNAPAPATKIMLKSVSGDISRLGTIPPLPAFKNFEPQTYDLSFTNLPESDFIITVDPEGEIDDFYRGNNVLKINHSVHLHENKTPDEK